MCKDKVTKEPLKLLFIISSHSIKMILNAVLHIYEAFHFKAADKQETEREKTKHSSHAAN